MNTPRFLGVAVWICCHDLNASLAYYRDVLGFTGDWNWTWGDPPDHAGVSRGRARIMLVASADDRAERFRGMEIVIYVRDVDASYREHQAAGADIREILDDREWGTRDYTVVDPNGVRLIFTEAPDEFGA